MLIAIDGTAASGKGTLGLAIANHFGLSYLNTGLIYRSLAAVAIQQKIKLDDIDGLLAITKNLQILHEDLLLSENIGEVASQIATFSSIRTALIEMQRDFAMSAAVGAVLDGRDIGTVICPNADYKFFITANPDIRAKRRQKQSGGNYDKILHDILARDERDYNRSIAPLKQADDAILIDTSNLTIDEVLVRAIEAMGQ